MFQIKQYMPEGRYIIRKTQYREQWYFQVVDMQYEEKVPGMRTMWRGSEPPVWLQARVAKMNATHQPLKRRA